MEQIVSFPGLGLGPFTLNRIAFTLFGRPVYWYGILIALAFAAGLFYILTRCRRFGLDNDHVLDVLLASMIGAVIGARVYYVIFSWDQYKNDLFSIFRVWEGGLAVYGGILGGFLVGYFFCKKRGVCFLPMADMAVCGILLGQGIGRWGNFINVEAFGSVTDAAWRMSSPSVASYLSGMRLIDEMTAAQIVDGTLGVHPTFFYESFWCIIGFILLALYTNHRRFDGELLLFYMLWYGLERAVVEGLRTDSLMAGDYRISQLLSFGLAVLAAILLFVNYRRLKRCRDPESCMLYVHTGESRALLAEADRVKREKDGQKTDKLLSEPKSTDTVKEEPKQDDYTQVEEQSDESEAN